jgi:hypothetical protein
VDKCLRLLKIWGERSVFPANVIRDVKKAAEAALAMPSTATADVDRVSLVGGGGAMTKGGERIEIHRPNIQFPTPFQQLQPHTATHSTNSSIEKEIEGRFSVQ